MHQCGGPLTLQRSLIIPLHNSRGTFTVPVQSTLPRTSTEHSAHVPPNVQALLQCYTIEVSSAIRAPGLWPTLVPSPSPALLLARAPRTGHSLAPEEPPLSYSGVCKEEQERKAKATLGRRIVTSIPPQSPDFESPVHAVRRSECSRAGTSAGGFAQSTLLWPGPQTGSGGREGRPREPSSTGWELGHAAGALLRNPRFPESQPC